MFRKITFIFVPLLCLLAAGSCSDLEDPAVCPSGLICPPGTMCAVKQDICISDSCGNGIIDGRADEVCDDGNIIAGDGCSQDCKSDEECGNGVTDHEVGEVCDDSNRISGDGCSADCASSEECGDGFVNELDGEQCDDGGNSANCDFDCTMVACGDGLVNAVAGEQCDPPSQTCSKQCQVTNCGDGIKDPGEDCDEGGVNTETCDADCTLPACGDGVHNARAGEPCDEGGQDTATCDGDCTPPACGDGWWNPANAEQCDTAGNSSNCDQDCTQVLCGDQLVNPMAGEECEDGNLVNTDECTTVCEFADCADGFQNADESDLDCGGHCGSSCEMLQSCLTSNDCITGICLGGACVPDWSRLTTGGLHTCLLAGTGAVRCWGYGSQGQLGYGNTNKIGDNEAPVSAGDVNVGGTIIQIAAGGDHTCALLNTGAVRCWGYGFYGQLGYGDTSNIGDNESPTTTGDVDVGGAVVQITAGGLHTCALLDTGAVRCWGSGTNGQLGYGNTNRIGDNEVPASAGDVNVGGAVVQLAAGYSHTCALLDTGAVRCWGGGGYGQLGYGNTNSIGDNESPASAGDVNIGGAAIQLAAGFMHTCALLDAGTIRCWGGGSDGRLGYGNTNNIGDNEAPATAGNVDIGSLAIQLAVGFHYTCVLLDTGAVRCWGGGWDGQLGYGNTSNIGDDELPAMAGNVNVGGTVIQIAANVHTCALLDTGMVRCWGAGASGQLGYGNTNNIGDNESPAMAGNVNTGSHVIQLATGGYHTCALLETGAIGCWGEGSHGQRGYGDTSDIGDDESPASAGEVNVGGSVIQLATGQFHTCALLATGAVRCWGGGGYGKLGYGNTNSIGDDESPLSAGDVNIGGTVVQIAASRKHTCALLDTGAVRCWGAGASGQLGYGNTNNIGDNEVPASAGNVNVGGSVIQLASGGGHTCALLGTGAVRCWGNGQSGRLGYGNTNSIGDNELPFSAGDVNVGGAVVQLAAGYLHTCALLATGAVRCWGGGGYGQLGYGNTNSIGDDEAPATAGNVNVGGSVTQLTAGSYHTCALLDTGAVRCWGLGGYGQLGYGNPNDIGRYDLPASAGNVNVGGSVVQIAAGEYHTCALLDTGAVRCWGYGPQGQLGYGNTIYIGDNESPASAGNVDVGGSIVRSAASSTPPGAMRDTGAVPLLGPRKQ